MKSRALPVVSLTSFFLSVAAGVQAAPSVGVNSGSGGTSSVTNVGTDLYDIVLTKSFGSTSNSADFTITAGSSLDKIRKLIVRNREPAQLLNVRITQFGTKIASIGSIEYGTGNDGSGHNDYDGVAYILAMRVAGNVGDIKVTRVFDSIIDGSVTA